VFQFERITFIYWPIERTSQGLFGRVMQLERTTFIYWAIECVPKALFGRAMQLEKNYLHLLGN
jgi:hypothetical protein